MVFKGTGYLTNLVPLCSDNFQSRAVRRELLIYLHDPYISWLPATSDQDPGQGVYRGKVALDTAVNNSPNGNALPLVRVAKSHEAAETILGRRQRLFRSRYYMYSILSLFAATAVRRRKIHRALQQPGKPV